MRQLIRRAMHDPDRLVVVIDYKDKKGNCTRRVISPIRFVTPGRFLALCLCREEPRFFQLERCRQVSLKPAHEYAMPVPIALV